MTIDVDNLVDNFVLNMKAIFENQYKSFGLKEIYTEDVLLVPVVPSLAISCTGFWNRKITLGKVQTRYEFTFMGELWYYHSTISVDVKRNLIMREAYKISQHILENASLNGWLISTRALVRACSYSPRARSGALMASARIFVIAPYQTRITIV